MADINKEIGLEDLLRGIGMGMGRTDSGGEVSSFDEDEKEARKLTVWGRWEATLRSFWREIQHDERKRIHQMFRGKAWI